MTNKELDMILSIVVGKSFPLGERAYCRKCAEIISKEIKKYAKMIKEMEIK